MSGSGSEIWWALIIGTVALLTLGVVFIASIIFNQRRFITVERKMLEALEERERRFRSLIEKSTDGITLLDAHGTIIYRSSSNLQITGFTDEEVIGKQEVEFIYPGDREKISQLLGKLVEVPGKVMSASFRFHQKNGTLRWMEATATNLLADPSVNAIVANYRDVTERKEAEEQLKRSHDQLRKLSAHLQSVREGERTHIAREIHDELGQMLTVLKMDLALLERSLLESSSDGTSPETLGEIESMARLIDGIIRSVRRIATELRPVVLDELGLREAIEWELEGFQSRTGVKSEFISSVNEIYLDRENATALFRILQETLTNVARHAKATEVSASLEIRDRALVLEIKDNGRGISELEASHSKSLGLLGMRERTLLLGGEISIVGEKSGGTLVSVRIPLHNSSLEASER